MTFTLAHSCFIFSSRQLRQSFKEEIVKELLTSPSSHTQLEAEFKQLKEDRETLRSIFPTGNSKVQHPYTMMLTVGM